MRPLRHISLVLCLTSVVVKAQHTPLTSQYLFNGLLINPAYAGSRDALTANLTARQQWVGFEGAPTTQLLSIHSPIKRTRVGVGLLITNDKIGVSRETGFLTNYAYRIPFRRGRLSFGLGAGMSVTNARWSDLAVQNGTDATFMLDTRSTWRPNFSAGTFYYRKKVFFGASLPFMLSHRFDPAKGRWVMVNSLHQLQPMLTGGGLIVLNPAIKLKPSTLVRYTAAAGVQADLNANLILQDKVWIGMSYRTGDAVACLLELLPTPQLRLGYAYDMRLGPLATRQSGSHEVMVQYEFGYQVKVRDSRIYF
ncbi:MAG: type IX secretion system membrane protein PorP/SprF [Flavobacteriales bacterium]|nr:type IX secretion system membrane protein PorP/SprF [Flavobacteriales bacterium]